MFCVTGLHSRRKLRVALGAIAVVLLSTLLVACGGSSDSQEATENGSPNEQAETGAVEGQASGELEPVELLLPAPAGINFAPFVLAQERCYRDEGLDVEGIPTDGSSVVAQQLVAGNAKFGEAGAASVYLANVEGGDLVGIAVNTHDDLARLSVPEDSPVQSVSDLQGKAIGITSAGDGSVPIVKAVVRQAGLVPDEDVQFVIVGKGGPAVAQALESGRIAAYAHGQSDVPGMEINAGVRLRSIMPEEFVGLPSNVLAVSRETLETPADLEIAIKLARCWMQEGIFLHDNPEEALEIGCEIVPRDCQNMDVARLQIAIGGETHYPFDLDRPGYMDSAKMRTLIEAVSGEVPIPIEDVFPNTYIDRIGEGLTSN